WRTIGMGFLIQVFLVWFVLLFRVGGHEPGYEFFKALGKGVEQFIKFTDAGTSVVFGKVANEEEMKKVFGKGDPPNKARSTKYAPFAFTALATIIFFASFFSVL